MKAVRHGSVPVLLAGLLFAAPGTATAARPAPSARLSLRVADQVTILQAGALRVRVSARHVRSVRLSATGAGVALVTARTVALPGGGTRTVALRLTSRGRRVVAGCARTPVRLTAALRGTNGGSRTVRLARAFACRGGELVSASSTGPATAVEDGAGAPGAGGGGPGGSSGAPTIAGQPAYQVGLDVGDTNPEPDGTYAGGKVYLGGYGFGAGNPVSGQGRAATGILTLPGLRDGDGQHVRAIAVDDGTHGLVIADLEAQGWFAAYKTGAAGFVDLRKRIAADLGLDPQGVILQSDHSHSGADAVGVWGGVPPAYLQHMADVAVRTAERAWVTRRPGRLYYGSVPARDLLTNQFADDPVNTSVDDGLRVLQARDADGKAFATLLNFSAHSTVLGADNTKISGDWEQAANPLLEQRFGGRAMTMVGTLGRTQPNRVGACAGSGDEANRCKLLSYAKLVVDRAADAVAAATPIDGAPLVAARSYRVQDVATNPVILGFDYAGDPAGVPIQRSISPPYLAGLVLSTSTQTARIGDVLLSAVPGEAYPQIALKVAATAKGVRAGGFMTAGLAGDQLGYLIAPLEAYPEPIRRSLFTDKQAADVIQECVKSPNETSCNPFDPVGNDNYLFNVSLTMGERVTCSLLRGSGELFGRGSADRDAYERCPVFANDAASAPGADLG